MAKSSAWLVPNMSSHLKRPFRFVKMRAHLKTYISRWTTISILYVGFAGEIFTGLRCSIAGSLSITQSALMGVLTSRGLNVVAFWLG